MCRLCPIAGVPRLSQWDRSGGSAMGYFAQQLALMHQKEKYYHSILARMAQGGPSVQNGQFKALNLKAERNKTNIVGLVRPCTGQRGRTFSFHLKGGFTEIRKTVQSLVQKESLGEIVSWNFKKRPTAVPRAPIW